MAELIHLDRLANRFADANAALDEEVKALQDAVENLKRVRMAKIAKLAGLAAEAELQLRAAIEESPEHFVRPKTMVLHGVKIGFQKAPDGIDWSDDETLIARIREKYPRLAKTLIKTDEKPVYKALQRLNDKQLKGLGVKKVEGSDQILVVLAEGDVEKVVTKMVDTAVAAGLKEAGR